jgi:hypothetical protein
MFVDFWLACFVVACLLIPSKRALQRSAAICGMAVMCFVSLRWLSGFWWQQLKLATDLSVHSTFSTSYPAIIRDGVAGLVVLLRLLRKEGVVAAREHVSKTVYALAVIGAAFVVTIVYHLSFTLAADIEHRAGIEIPQAPRFHAMPPPLEKTAHAQSSTNALRDEVMRVINPMSLDTAKAFKADARWRSSSPDDGVNALRRAAYEDFTRVYDRDYKYRALRLYRKLLGQLSHIPPTRGEHDRPDLYDLKRPNLPPFTRYFAREQSIDLCILLNQAEIEHGTTPTCPVGELEKRLESQ